jgi:hypothetical protein
LQPDRSVNPFASRIDRPAQARLVAGLIGGQAEVTPIRNVAKRRLLCMVADSRA